MIRETTYEECIGYLKPYLDSPVDPRETQNLVEDLLKICHILEYFSNGLLEEAGLPRIFGQTFNIRNRACYGSTNKINTI